MREKKLNPVAKLVIELAPIAAFFVAYSRMKGEHFLIAGTSYNAFIVITAAFIPLMMLSTGLLWVLTGKLSKMQIATLVLVVVFGGLSVWFNDEQFFKMKPTIIYLLFGGILGVGLLRGESYLKLVIEEVLPMKHEGWMILTKRICLFFFALAAANEVVWRTMSTAEWVTFKTFVLTAALFVFFMGQGRLMQKYAVEEEAGD
ncbi:inner membrane-spanning protein YciB [Solirhodobacter olei]|uniref:inner membrane-spanning protein YciB n=1 Tax=Solirhodobacter olei TaxID=2493082 RepID=UPI000FDBA248|nr:inner membrane-spanning protein YciB [Solirhodobacter olei]